jgi:hypothetical protein
MRCSRMIVGPAVALLALTVAAAGTCAQTVDQAAKVAGQNPEKTRSPIRQRQNSQMSISKTRSSDPNAPPWVQPPIPETIPIRVAGVARDESGRAIAGATITLYPITDKSSKAVGAATSDLQGRYEIRNAVLPVTASFGGHKFPKEITPYASFILNGIAPGLGIAWSPQQSMYALKEPNPDDIQGRLPLKSSVGLDLAFPKAAAFKGRVVDEDGQPVEGAKLQVLDSDLLDDAGHETNNRQGYDWKALPERVGRAVTARDGGFRIEGLADRACYWIQVNRPETDNASSGFYAATIAGPDTVHEQLPAAAFNGRLRHEVKTNPITVVFPKIRPIAVTVLGDDTGKPLAGVRVFTLKESLATGIASFGTTDSSGKVLLGLPPGQYKGVCSDPLIETCYIRTYQRPLVVERGEGAQPYEIRQKAGVELIIETVGPRPGTPVAGAFFWKAPEDQPEATERIESSTFVSGAPWTDAKGEMRAVLPAEPGRRYRFRFAGIHQPNMSSSINPVAANKQGFEAFPSQSAPVELVAGKTIRLRFILHTTE